MSRKINALKLSNKLKTELRSFYNEQNGTKFRNITEITRNLQKTQNVAGADQAYSVIANKYNDQIKLKQKAERAKKAKAKREQKLLSKASPVIMDHTYTKTHEVIHELTNDLVSHLNRDLVDDLQAAAKKLSGKPTFYVQFLNVVKLVDNRYTDADTIYWELLFPIFFEGSDKTDSIIQKRLKVGESARVVILLRDDILPQKQQQKYRDGEVHCVLNPIYSMFMKQSENSQSDSSRKKLASKANRMKQLEQDYPEGVPEEDMEEVAKAAQLCIIIHDLLGNETVRYNSAAKHCIKFTNTRINHVEKGYLCLDEKPIKVSQEELNQIKLDHDKSGSFYFIRSNSIGNFMIKSLSGCWELYNEENDIMNNFSKEIDIHKCAYDALKYPQMNELIREARIVNAAPTPLCDEPNNIEGANHIDLTKAYTQHKACPYYAGFMGVIHQWRKLNVMHNVGDFLENHLGIFQFTVRSGNDFLKTFGIYSGKTYSLPSVEILYFIREFKMTCTLLAGCWGSRFDFDYTEEMLENRRYCNWAGKNGMQFDVDLYTFSGDADWCAHLKTVLGTDNVVYYDGRITCKIQKKASKTRHHILAFITSYTRINMFEIMRKIPSESLIKVMLDGLYFRGDVPDIALPHKKDKELKEHLGFREFWYYPSTVDTAKWPEYKKQFDGRCVLAGAGGTGKTHTILSDKGFVNPKYIVPMHVLGKEIKSKYGVSYNTIHKFAGIGFNGKKCLSTREEYHEVPSVILIDELTMHDGQHIDKVIQLYPESLIFVAGDVDEKQWYQCRNGDNGEFKPLWDSSSWRFTYFDKDYRALDSELKQFKLDVRAKMREIFTNGKEPDALCINEWVKANYPTLTFQQGVDSFRAGDIWIAGTHKTNAALLANGVVSGYMQDKQISDSGEKKGAFTIHSYQGLTIADKRVFVSLDNFEYAMFYTAISRVRRMSQLIFVA